jgi:hypothetical protein
MGGATTRPESASTLTTGSLMKQINSECLGMATSHPYTFGKQGSQAHQTPPRSHVSHLKQLRELHTKLEEEQQWLQQL